MREGLEGVCSLDGERKVWGGAGGGEGEGEQGDSPVASWILAKDSPKCCTRSMLARLALSLCFSSSCRNGNLAGQPSHAHHAQVIDLQN